MNTVNSNLTWIMALLIIAIVFIYLIHLIIKRALFRKSETEVYSQDAYGWHLAFSFLIAGLLLSKLPELLDAGMYLAKGDPSKVVISEGFRLGSIFFGLSFVFFFAVYYLSYSVVKLLHPKSSLRNEIAINNIGYVLQHAAIMLLMLLIVQYNFVALCKYFLPQSNVPFYR